MSVDTYIHENNNLSNILKTTATKWLEWQCKMLSDVKVGAVFLENKDNNTIEILSLWSEDDPINIEEKLHILATDIIKNKKNIHTKLHCHIGVSEEICDVLSLPLHENNKVVGAVILLQLVRSEEHKKAVLQLFQWGTTWLESMLLSESEDSLNIASLSNRLVTIALKDEPLAITGYKLCNFLSENFYCTRVVLAEVKGLRVHTLSMSHQLRFDLRSSHIHEIELAMEEALDQKKMIQYPQTEEISSSLVQKHKSLSHTNEDATVLTVPLLKGEEVVALFLLLRPKNHLFTVSEIKILHDASEQLASVFKLKLKEEHVLSKRLIEGVKKKLIPVFGEGHLLLKLIITGVVILFALLIIVKTPYNIYAKSSLEGAIQQVLVSPYDGFIDASYVRAGERVKKSQILLTLNDHDMKLQQLKLLSEHEKLQKEYREALALRERSKVSILSAQIAQVDAKLNLLDEQLKRSLIRAPFDGIVVSGDLSQSLGAPVEKGEALFKLSPLGNYRVILEVNDEDISKLKIEEKGSLRLVGLPYDEFPIRISRIIPISSVKGGGNYFRVEAQFMDNNETRLKPGMQGITRVKVGEESMLWVFSHTLLERIRLWFWSVGV